TVFDALVRRGTESNLAWLRECDSARRLKFIQDDIRNLSAVRAAVEDADQIYHLAAQVAVTTSVADPGTDFEVNALGTLNVLEAVRLSGRPIPVLFTSTNKVYGGLEGVETIEGQKSYYFKSLPLGVPESRALDFHSPYGCSKGAADQYVRDYNRIYGIPTVVFRMSCIYGPRQFGNEDQGWVAHFLISVATGSPITIYGNGKQVRDVLFIDDLVRAFRLAITKIDVTVGQIYNIGGGASNALAVWTEFGEILSQLSGSQVSPAFGDWRPGDQPCYISDIRKAEQHMGWKPQVDKLAGIRRLWNWVKKNRALFSRPPEAVETVKVMGAMR